MGSGCSKRMDLPANRESDDEEYEEEEEEETPTAPPPPQPIKKDVVPPSVAGSTTIVSSSKGDGSTKAASTPTNASSKSAPSATSTAGGSDAVKKSSGPGGAARPASPPSSAATKQVRRPMDDSPPVAPPSVPRTSETATNGSSTSASKSNATPPSQQPNPKSAEPVTPQRPVPTPAPPQQDPPSRDPSRKASNSQVSTGSGEIADHGNSTGGKPTATPTPPSASPTSTQAPRKSMGSTDNAPVENMGSKRVALPVQPQAMVPSPLHQTSALASSESGQGGLSDAAEMSGLQGSSLTIARSSGRHTTQVQSTESQQPDDVAMQLPRKLQNKFIRSITLSTSSLLTTQPVALQPAVLFGALGDMMGERLQHPHVVFDLRRLIRAAPVVLSFRMTHHMTQYLDTLRTNKDAVKRGSVGFGTVVKEPVFAMLMSGPPLMEQPSHTHRTHTQKQILQRVGMYGATLWMPSTLRKGNRRRQRSQFVYQRELLSIMTHGVDAAACFVAHMLPDVLINLQAFDLYVRQTMTAAVRATLHKLYDVLVAREEKMREDHEGNGHLLRAPRVDISLVYLRDDGLYATTTVGAQEGQLFLLVDSAKQSHRVIALESDSHNDSEGSYDDKSISSAASFMSSSSNTQRGGNRKEPKRRYDMPSTTTFYCQLSDFADATGGATSAKSPSAPTPLADISPQGTGGGGGVRMATFSRQTSTSSYGNGNSSGTSVQDAKSRFAVVLSTEAFWSTLNKKEVWDLLFMMNELEYEAQTRRSVEKTPSDIVRMIDSTLPESTVAKLVKFYNERAEAHFLELPPMPEMSMAAVLSEVAEAKAMIENTDYAARMSVTVITLR